MSKSHLPTKALPLLCEKAGSAQARINPVKKYRMSKL
jgi:hypothetical protein